MVITNTRTYNDMNITINGNRVPTSKCIKYLGIHIDSGWKFKEHAKTVAAKARKVVQGLSRILLNISAAKPAKRKLLSNVAHSIMLYGSPFWVQDMSPSGWEELFKVQRCMLLRVASAYCTVSKAIEVITSTALLDLLAKSRKIIYDTRSNNGHPPVTEDILTTWQEIWNRSTKGRWTHRLIPVLEHWVNRKHGSTNFHVTQALTGQGFFPAYLHRFGKLDSPACWY